MSQAARCAVLWLGQVDYDAAWELQKRLAGEIAAGARPPTLLLLEHPHVYTFGSLAERANLLWDEAELARRGIRLRAVDRGGDVTYHGPGQLVGYPLLPLAALPQTGGKFVKDDFIGYVRRLEETLILALAGWGVTAQRVAGKTGVWVADAKIASIGVKIDVRRVTRHGFALNIAPDMSYWQGIVPCGLAGVRMTSLAELVVDCPTVEQAAWQVAAAFGEVFGLEWAAMDFNQSDGQ